VSDLGRFFAAQGRFYAAAMDPAAAARGLLAEFPGWAAAPPRVELYADFVSFHVRDVVERTYGV
jgi:hypothetical protein